ncbi:hypothetical protein VPNG_04099 [Cytospora leucostoma]|uniref:Uncharacterized protein n=1 Tax=Cytospora leucostoma TaxID=1230097 RepID=A0A423XD38_9PEZI|nr:hypothetical protein VPNG_04099 [Cytospora leucostoma]
MSTAAQASEAEGSRPLQHHHMQPDQAGERQPRPSDYDMFIRQAEEDDQRRTAKAGKQQQQQPPPSNSPPLNPFYSNNWASQPDPPGGNSTNRLAEIQESDDEDAFSSASASASTSTSSSTEHTPAADPCNPQHPAPPSRGGAGGTTTTAGAAARDDNDVASSAARRFSLPRRALTEPCVQQAGGVGGVGGGRHVQFSRNAPEVGEREKERERERLGGRRGSSGSSCAHRLKSPPRPVRRQRSMMKMIADYIRHPRG